MHWSSTIFFAYLKKDEHEYSIGSESDERRRPAFEKKFRTFVTKRFGEDVDK